MLSVLNQISLIHTRACKNRTGFHFAWQRAMKDHASQNLITNIQEAASRNVTLIDNLDAILDQLGRTPGPTQP